MINIKSNRYKISIIILCLFLMYIAVWIISPPLFVNGLARLLALICMLVILISELVKHDNGDYQGKYLFILIIYIFFTGVLGFYAMGMQYFNINIQLYILMSMGFICVNNISSNNKLDRYKLDKIFFAILILYPVWMITTLIAYESDPYISRALSGSRIVDVYYWSTQGVGGYAMVYSLVFYNIILLYSLLFLENKQLKRLLLIINYILSLFVILKAGYSIAILAIIFGSIIIIFVRNNRMINMLIIIFLFLSVTLLFYIFKNSIYQFFISISDHTLYQDKVKDIIYSIQNGNTMGSLDDRIVRYQFSIDNFLENILFGTSVHGQLIFGGHSLFLDTFSEFGLIGGLPLLYLLLYYPVSCIKNNKAFSLSLAILAILLFIGTTNTLAASIGPMIYIVYPNIVNQKERSRLNNEAERSKGEHCEDI